jgi:hypothetical protein
MISSSRGIGVGSALLPTMRKLFLLLLLSGCGAKYPNGPPTITETGASIGRTFLFRRVEMLRVGGETTTDTFAAEETLAEGKGKTVTAVKLNILDEGRKQETGDSSQIIAYAAGERMIVRAKGEGLEMWTLPDKAGVRPEVEAIVARLYSGIGREDPFLANIPQRPLLTRAKAPEYEQALGAYFLASGAFSKVDDARAFIVGIRDTVVTIHVDLTLAHEDKECSYKANLKAELTVRRAGGDLAHLEAKGPLAGTCGTEKTEGRYELTVDRSQR